MTSTVRRPALALVVVQLAASAALAVLWGSQGPSAHPVQVAGIALAYALVGLLPLRLELRRHSFTVTLTEGVLVVGLFAAGAPELALAVAAGEALACAVLRQGLLEIVVNSAQAAFGALAAALAFSAVAPPDPSAPSAWLGVLLAVATAATLGLLSTGWVVARAEGRPLEEILRSSLLTTTITGASAASIGLVVVLLARLHPLAPLLLAPLLVLIVVETRGLAAQRAEHLRVRRLYEASARSTSLSSLDEVLAALAEEARGLLTGVEAACATVGGDGAWRAMAAGDAGSRALEGRAVAALRALADGGDEAAAWPAFAERSGEIQHAVADRGGLPVVLAVRRQRGAGDAEGAAEVLAAFGSHAALAVANAELYQEVESALRRQIDLNRQKDEFVAAVSHELRTPLTSVLASVKTVQRLGERLEAADRGQLLEQATEQGDRLRRLIEDLLLAASADQGALLTVSERVELPDLLADVARELAPLAGDRLRVVVDPQLGAVGSDGHRLRQILTNLVENAAKYAPDSAIELRGKLVGRTCYLSVRDWGPGVAPEDRERVFHRFVQLDQSSTRRCGGTGLGLYLCRQLAEALGASLALSSPPDGGACFSLALPAGEQLPAPGGRPTLVSAMSTMSARSA